MEITVAIRGGTVRIDEDMLEALLKYNWYVHSGGYARADYGRRGYIYMHQIVLGKSDSRSIQPDHKDRNKLNNTRANLRWLTARGNTLHANQNTKGYYWRAERNCWQVRFKIDGRLHYFGTYAHEADARDKADTIKANMRQGL